MRSIAIVAAALALGLGGVALAQPRLIVDPWPRAANGASASPGSTEIHDAKTPSNGATKFASDEAHALSRIASGLGGGAVNFASDEAPALSRITSGLGGGARAAAKPAAIGPRRVASWSARLEEIVDPWQRAPQFTADYGAKLIVDPWAPSVRRAPVP